MWIHQGKLSSLIWFVLYNFSYLLMGTSILVGLCMPLFKHLIFSLKHGLGIARRSRAVLAEICNRTEVKGMACVR